MKKVKAFFLLLLLEMAKPGYLYMGKTFILPQTQGKGATPLFLCVKTKTASRTNCSRRVQAKKLLRCFLEKGGECYSTVARRGL